MLSKINERIEIAEITAEPWWLKKLAAENGVHGLVAAVLGLAEEDMDAIALKKGKEEIKKKIKETQKRSMEEKEHEDLTHKEDLAPTIDNHPKLPQALEEMQMILEALFGQSETPSVLGTLARGLEVVLQTLSMKAFSKKRDFNKDHLHALFDFDEKAQLLLGDPKLSHPFLSLICTRIEFPEELKGLKNYIRELESFIQAQPNGDESHKNLHHSSSKGTSSPK